MDGPQYRTDQYRCTMSTTAQHAWALETLMQLVDDDWRTEQGKSTNRVLDTLNEACECDDAGYCSTCSAADLLERLHRTWSVSYTPPGHVTE